MHAGAQLHVEPGLQRLDEAQNIVGGCIRFAERDGLEDGRGIAADIDGFDLQPMFGEDALPLAQADDHQAR